MAEIRQILDFFNREAPNLCITAEILANPQSEYVLRMYYFLCDLIFNFDENELYDNRNEEFGKGMLIRRIFSLLTDFFGDVFNNDTEFNYVDLLMPDPTRSKYFILQLTRFYTFKCERMVEVEGIATELDERRRDVDAEKAFEATTANKLEQEKENYEELKKKLEERKKTHEELRKDLELLKSRSNASREEFELKKKHDKELEDKINHIQAQITEEREKSSRLDSNIVSSPDRILNEIANYEKEFSEVSDKQNNVGQECRKLERDINSQTITMKVIERMETELHHLEQLHENVRKLLCDFDEKIENFKIVDDNVIQIDREIGQIQTQNESQMQQLKKQQIVNQRNKLNLKQKKTGLEEAIADLRNLISASREEKEQCKKQLKESEYQLIALGEEFDQIVNFFKQSDNVIKNRLKKEENVINKLMNTAKTIYEKR